MASFPQYAGLPLMGTITTDSGSRVIHISETYETDSRDEGTFYVATSSNTDEPVVFLFIVDPEQGGFLLQAVENRSSGGEGKTDGMYLAVHKATPNDELYPDFVRVIVHSEKEKAAVWALADVDGQKLLEIKANPDETGEETVGWYLAVPPDSERDETSNFLAVTSDAGQATAVAASAASGEGGFTAAVPATDYEPAEETYGEEPAEETYGEEAAEETYGGGEEETGYGEPAEETYGDAAEETYGGEEPSYGGEMNEEGGEEGGGDGYGESTGYSYE